MSSDDALRVVACVIRREVTVDLGISFRQDVVNGCLVIDSLASDGLFAKTGLKLDMFLLKINGHKCYRISKEKLDKTETMLKQAKGIVTIEALSPARIILNEPQINERQVFSIQKASPNFQLGLGLEKIQTPEDSLRVVKVSPTFQKILGLKQGLELISVNGAPCDVNDIDGVQTHMKDAFPMVSLECVATVKNTMYKKEKEGLAAAPEPKEEKEDVDENVKVVACVLRREAFLELGIDFRRDVENGFLIIDTVSKDGLFANTGLKPNQRVLKINGHRISRKRLDQAVEVLQKAKGLITIEAHSFVKNAPEEGSKIEKQIFSIQKATKAFQLGLGLEKIQTPEDTLRIVKVSPTFQKVLGLTPGLQLVKVNGVDCDVNNIASVEEQMSKAFPMLSLECQATIVIKKNEEEENDDDDENIRVVACIVRPQSDLPLGLTYHPDSENGHLVIDSVDPHGFFAKSGMKPGLHIMRVNGKRISQKNLDQAVDILKTIKGWVTLEAELTRNPEKFVERRFYSIQKSNRNFQLGLGLGTVQLPEESTPSLRIIEVSPTFQKVLGLKPGLHLAKVNGDRCNKNDIQSVHKHMDAAFPMLSLECIAAIVKKKKGEPKPVVHIEVPKDEEKEQGEVGVRVVACIVRPESFLDLGITFKQDVENGRLLIEAVASHGLFGSTGLGPNQKLVKINGKKISKRKLDQALELLKQVKGRITLEAESIAQNPESSAERQIFSIQKPNKNFQLGLGFGVEQHDDKRLLRIFKASPTLERVLGLKQGLQLVKVNGASVNIDDLQSVNDQLDEAFPILTLECMASFERTVMRGIHRVDSDLTEAMSVNPEDEARRLKEEQEARAKDQEERVKAQEEERLAAEAEAKAAEEARVKAEEEARLKAEEEARLKEEARIKTEQEEEARRKAEEEAIKAAEEARRKAEEEAKAAEEARLEAEEEARLKAEEEARVKAEEEARRKAEEEARAAEEARIAAEEAARRTAEEEARLRAEARIKAEEEEEARRKSIIEEEEARRKAEEEAIKAAEEASRKAEEEAKARAEEEFRLKTEEAARRAAAQEAREQAQEESRLKAYRASKVRAEEEAKLWEEASIKAEAEAKLAEAEETKKKEKREKRIAANKEMQKNKFASSGDSGFGFFSSGLGEPLIKVKEKTNEDDDLAPAPDSSGNDEIDDLIRQAEERQRQIEQELLDLAWD